MAWAVKGYSVDSDELASWNWKRLSREAAHAQSTSLTAKPCPTRRHVQARGAGGTGFLEKIDAAYWTDTAIKLILDNHSAHISKETKRWLASQPEGRFTLVFTPKHGSWLNLVEGLFSKMARSVLRSIRVASKDELKARILAYLDDLNREPIIHTWTYKLDAAAG